MLYLGGDRTRPYRSQNYKSCVLTSRALATESLFSVIAACTLGKNITVTIEDWKTRDWQLCANRPIEVSNSVAGGKRGIRVTGRDIS